MTIKTTAVKYTVCTDSRSNRS